MNPRSSIVLRNAQLDAMATQAVNGYLRIYSGSQPATPETAPGGTLLAELRFGSPAFGAASAGSISANAITDDASADATGTAAWFRILKSDGSTALYDGDCGTSGADLVLNSVNIQAGARVSISSLAISMPMQG
jgi:hypothetical protein